MLMYSSMKCYATIHGVIAEKSIFFEQDIVSANNVIIYSLYDLFQVRQQLSIFRVPVK